MGGNTFTYTFPATSMEWSVRYVLLYRDELRKPFKVLLTLTFFLLIKSISFTNYFSEEIITIGKNSCVTAGVWICNFYVRDRAKWDLGRATSDVTAGTERYQNIFGLFVIHILSKTDTIFQ